MELSPTREAPLVKLLDSFPAFCGTQRFNTEFANIFRQRHSTIEQTHRVVRKVHESLENKKYCSAAFLDISQAFNKA
jgi:hypothetical protein